MFSLYSLKHIIILTSFSLLQTTLASAVYPRLDNGLAITPPMGWNSYNHYSCSPNESIITSNAQALVDLGLLDLGYHYATVDCGWTLPNRTANGTLTWNPALFPSGYPALGDFIHSLGLKFGVYSDGGIQMCMTGTPAQVGSLGHETTDADTFAAWGADLLKYDNCYSDAALDYPDTSYTPSLSPKEHYVTMSAAVLATGREIAFQICDWGVDFPSAWAPSLGNTWRVTNDIIPAYRTIPRILNQAVPQTSFAGPGQWLDLDMLEVGNNVFTTDEEKTHFSLWAIIKSPLVIGCALKDTLTSINANSLAILKNTDVISYNQDSLGVAASFRRRWTEDEYEVWAGPLSGDRYVIALINNADVERELTLDLPVVGLQKVGWLKDVWSNVTVTDVKTSYSGTVGAHGVLLVEVGELTTSGTYNVEDSVLLENSRKFTDIYGITTSNNYTATYTLTNGTIINDSITLNTTATNTLTTSLPLTGNLTITPPLSTFYPSTLFTTTGTASLTTCYTGLCTPVGSKITYLGGADSNTASTTLTSPKTSISGSKYVEIYFCNNDIALATSWGSGTNTRNLTIGVNGVTTRIEVPLSGKSSELYSPGLGWEDTGIFGVVLDGLFEGAGAVNDVVVGNVGGVDGIVEWGADFVGLDVWW